MYSSIQDFIADWKTEAESTISLFSKISDEKLPIKVTENTRSLGRLAWHITQTLTEMPSKAGMLANDSLENAAIPTFMNEIISTYQKQSDNLIKVLQQNWTDSELFEKIDMYGEKWEKRQVLAALVKHQIHHRAQMTVLMRLQDIEVPGIYGPSKEEWVKFGMQPFE